MASTTTMRESIFEERFRSVHKYRWPAVQLNVWMLVMLGSACAIVGIFATFTDIQRRLMLGIPWYFPYLITVGSLAIVYIGVILFLIFRRRLLPSIVLAGGFLIFVLWLVGLIVLSVQLWGPSGDVSDNCSEAVFSVNQKGQSISTLAWLEERSICQSWQAAFAFSLIGAIFMLWIMAMAYQVFADR